MWISTRRLCLLSGILLLASGCTGEPSGSDLDPFLCLPQDLGDGYRELVRGDFTAKDLADLGGREPAEGMRRGKFVFLKESLPRPPFEPPMHVLCQVAEFDDEEGAGDWVAALDPAAVIDAAAIAWFPSEAREVIEHPDVDTPGADSRFRHFEISAGTGRERVAVWMFTTNLGRMAITFAAGLNEPESIDAQRELVSTLRLSWSDRTKDEPTPK